MLAAITLIFSFIGFLKSPLLAKDMGETKSMKVTQVENVRSSIYAPYWKLGEGFESTLLINNVLPRPIVLQPLVYTSDGELLPATPIPIGGLESKQILLRDIVETKKGDGQIGFSFDGMAMDIAAQIVITNEARRFSFNHVFMAPMGKTNTLEGVGYLPRPSSSVDIALANISSQPLEAQLSLSVGAQVLEEIAVQLGPHATKMVSDLTNLNSRIKGRAAIGIRVSYTGTPGDLIIQGMVTNSPGYSTNIRYVDPSALKSDRLITPIASLREGSPVLVARNITQDAVELRTEVRYTLDGQIHTLSLSPNTLVPGESGAFEISQELRSLPPAASNIALELISSRSSSVLADLVLVDGTDVKAVQVTPKDAVGESVPAHDFPWQVGQGVDTVFAVTNPSQTDPLNYSLFIYYGNGKVYSHREHILQPGEARHISIHDLIVNKVPDDLGAILPPDATFGQAKAVVRGELNKDIRLLGEAILIDATRGVAATLSCPSCPADPTYLIASPNKVVGRPGDSTYVAVTQFYSDGSYFVNPYTLYGVPNDYLVAEYIPNDVYLKAPGFTLITVFNPECAWSNDGETCHCDIPVTPTTSIGAYVLGVTFQKSDGSSLPSPLRVGISSVNFDRRQHLRVVVAPSSLAQYFQIQVSGNLQLSNVSSSGNIITFDVVGLARSMSRGDQYIRARYNGDFGGQAFNTDHPVSVVVPWQIATPYDLVGVGPVITNRAINADTSPVDPNIPSSQYRLLTTYLRNLTVTVLDQFTPGDPVGDAELYGNSMIYESDDFGGTFFAINQRLFPDSTYLDPVGVFRAKPTPPIIVSASDTTTINSWLASPPQEMPTLFVHPYVVVRVDFFVLDGTGLFRRSVTTSPPDSITITSP